jgi:hypothetical protein
MIRPLHRQQLDSRARLERDHPPRGHIPRRELDLVEAVDAAGGHS